MTTSPYPCPSCGGKTKVYSRIEGIFYVMCNSCKMRGPFIHVERKGIYGKHNFEEDVALCKALDAWNTLASK